MLGIFIWGVLFSIWGWFRKFIFREKVWRIDEVYFKNKYINGRGFLVE